MSRPSQSKHLLIVCGVPGSGKSTLAHHVSKRWGAVSFASETFADQLGDNARSPSGDLTREAVAHAYSAMGEAVAAALESNKLVVAVGSFRTPDQRRLFREIARNAGANVTIVRTVAGVGTASERVRLRLATGERGPNSVVIRHIDAEISQASDIDVTLMNETSVGDFYRRIDSLLDSLGMQSAELVA